MQWNSTSNVIRTAIMEKVAATSWIDVHEHLIEESRRLAGPQPADPLFPCDDWAYLLHHYAQDDLLVAGMPRDDIDRFFSIQLSPQEKWSLLAPYWPRIRYTGYGRAVRSSLVQLFGIDDLQANSVEEITIRLRAQASPGFYRRILQGVANIESCHVNSSEYIFCETEQPDLLFQDLSIVHLSSAQYIPQLRAQTGRELTNLQEYHRLIDTFFERYGAQAVAVKSQQAYSRRLNYTDVRNERAAQLYEHYLVHPDSQEREGLLKGLQDNLWWHCVRRAAALDLPIKLHTGYHGGTNNMPLAHVSRNLSDLCPILRALPNARFVLMHIGYPYQDELVALAKHYDNVYADLSCMWIISPAAAVRFVREFLMAAPWNKLLVFGGDYHCVENVPGHAQIARQGLVQALGELVEENWLSLSEALSLVEPLMNGNARQLFNMAKKTQVARAIMDKRQRETRENDRMEAKN